MQQTPTTPDGSAAQRGTATGVAPDLAKVISLAVARNRRYRRTQAKATPVELEQLDLRGVDLDRMTPEAREHYWFNLNKYARHLYVASCELSMAECDHPYSPICVGHVREAELHRMTLQGRRMHKYFGLFFVLDGLQILGAAACGALATKPALVSTAGVIPLAAALGLTVLVFLTREALAARTGSY